MVAPSEPVLAVSASRGPYACALRASDGRVRVEVEARGGVAPAVDRLFAAARLPADALGALVLDLGPGSYTGLRVAVAFAAALRAFAGVEVRTATSLELLALHGWRERSIDRARVVRPVLDARRGRVHHAPVTLEERVALSAPPGATSLDELREAVRPGEVLLAAAPLHAALAPIVRAAGATLAEEAADAASLARLLLDPLLAAAPATGPLEPLYLMGSYAEG